MNENENKPELVVTMSLTDFERIKSAVAEGHTDVANIIANGNHSTVMYETVTRLGFAMIQLSKMVPAPAIQTIEAVVTPEASVPQSAKNNKRPKRRIRICEDANYVPMGFVTLRDLSAKVDMSYEQVYRKLSYNCFSPAVTVDRAIYVNEEKAKAFLAA